MVRSLAVGLERALRRWCIGAHGAPCARAFARAAALARSRVRAADLISKRAFSRAWCPTRWQRPNPIQVQEGVGRWRGELGGGESKLKATPGIVAQAREQTPAKKSGRCRGRQMQFRI